MFKVFRKSKIDRNFLNFSDIFPGNLEWQDYQFKKFILKKFVLIFLVKNLFYRHRYRTKNINEKRCLIPAFADTVVVVVVDLL